MNNYDIALAVLIVAVLALVARLTIQTIQDPTTPEMSNSGFKTKLKAADLEAAIVKRLAEKADCAGITYVYVKATGR